MSKVVAYIKVKDVEDATNLGVFKRLSDGKTAVLKLSWFKESKDEEGNSILVGRSTTKVNRLMDGNTYWS